MCVWCSVCWRSRSSRSRTFETCSRASEEPNTTQRETRSKLASAQYTRTLIIQFEFIRRLRLELQRRSRQPTAPSKPRASSRAAQTIESVGSWKDARDCEALWNGCKRRRECELERGSQERSRAATNQRRATSLARSLRVGERLDAMQRSSVRTLVPASSRQTATRRAKQRRRDALEECEGGEREFAAAA